MIKSFQLKPAICFIRFFSLTAGPVPDCSCFWLLSAMVISPLYLLVCRNASVLVLAAGVLLVCWNAAGLLVCWNAGLLVLAVIYIVLYTVLIYFTLYYIYYIISYISYSYSVFCTCTLVLSCTLYSCTLYYISWTLVLSCTCTLYYISWSGELQAMVVVFGGGVFGGTGFHLNFRQKSRRWP